MLPSTAIGFENLVVTSRCETSVRIGVPVALSSAWPESKSTLSVRSRITSPRWSIDVWISPENPCSFAYESTCALISSRFDCSSAACCFSAAFWAGDFGATLPIRLCDMIWKVESICWLAVADWTPWMRVGSPAGSSCRRRARRP